jgi:hypothetical protein
MSTINWSDNACDDPAKAIVLGREDKPKLNWCVGSSAGDDTMVENLDIVRAITSMCSNGDWSAQIRLWSEDWAEIGDEGTYFLRELLLFDDTWYVLARRALPSGACDYGNNSHILIPVALIASILFN